MEGVFNMKDKRKHINVMVAALFISMLMVIPISAIASADEGAAVGNVQYDETTVGELLELAGYDTNDIPDDILSFGMPIPADEPLIFPILAGIVVGLVVGMIIDHFWGDTTDNAPVANEQNVNAALRSLRSDIITSNWDNVGKMFTKLINNDAQLLAFTEAYWMLQAETATSDLWSENGTFVPDRILTRSTFMDNLTTYKFNVLSAINEFSLSLSTQRDIFNDPAKASAYGSMRYGWLWGTTQWIDTTGTMWMSMTDYVQPTSESNRVFIDVIDFPSRPSNTNNMYLFGGPGTITNVTTGTQYSLTSGANDLLSKGVKSGWYDLSLGPIYAGNLMPSASVNGMEPNAAMILQSNGSYAIAYADGAGTYTVQRGSTLYLEQPDVSVVVTYPDADGVTQTSSVPIDHMLLAYQAVEDAINNAAESTAKAGRAAWIIFDQLGTSSSLIKPSSILSGMQSNTNITAEQQAAIYAVAMKQLAQFGDKVRPEDITISRESLDLVVHGDIFYRGAVIAQNAVFTPFAFLQDQTIAVGSHDWNAPGIAMIWVTGVPSLEDWDGKMMQYIMVDLSEGYQMKINDIVASGVQVSVMDLQIQSMEKIGLVDFGIPDNTPIFTFSKPIDIVMYITAIVILAMMLAIVLIWNYAPPMMRPKLTLITLAVGAVVWLIWSGTLAAWLDALFDMMFGWLPFAVR
jgi:hypothetical protein